MRASPADADAVARLPDGLVIDTENEIGVRDLAAKLRFFLLCQVTAVALVLDYLEGAGRPAAPDRAPDLAGHTACGAGRGASGRVERYRRPVVIGAGQPEAVQISGLRCLRRGRVLRAPLLREPEDAAGVRVVVIGLQPARQFAIA